MRSRLLLAGIGTTAILMATLMGTGAAVARARVAPAVAGVLTADYQMNEPTGSS